MDEKWPLHFDSLMSLVAFGFCLTIDDKFEDFFFFFANMGLHFYLQFFNYVHIKRLPADRIGN